MRVSLVINEIKKVYQERDELRELLQVAFKTQDEQKTKKTNKMLRFANCRSKALYATKKYGCSGIERCDECLECEFRK